MLVSLKLHMVYSHDRYSSSALVCKLDHKILYSSSALLCKLEIPYSSSALVCKLDHKIPYSSSALVCKLDHKISYSFECSSVQIEPYYSLGLSHDGVVLRSSLARLRLL